MAEASGAALYVKQGAGAKAGRQYSLPADLWERKEYPA
jgi:hypothetical protein